MMPRLMALAACAALTLLAACTTTPTAPGSGERATVVEARAREALQAGDLRLAAELYRQLAAGASGTARAGYLLEAARPAIEAGDIGSAVEWLREAERGGGDDQRKAAAVLLADVDVRQGRAASAMARLDGMAEPLPLPVMTEAQAVRGRALFELGRTVEAVRTLVERETWLETSEAILDNQRTIWEGLRASVFESLRPTGDDAVDGWLALAPVAAAGFTGSELRRALLDWRQDYPRHPAAAALLAELLAGERSDEAYPARLALLLPISSPQRAAAIALRDGFLAAHFAARAAERPGSGAAIRIYDTGLLGAEEAYLQAQLEGADFIVGPLLRPEVERVAARAGFVPTLALNFIQDDTLLVNEFYQFALWPEDEARAIARRAFDDGARTAVALVPSTEWGYRLLNGFRDELEALGGRFLGHNGYDTSAQDFSAPIESLLNLDRSTRRHTRLAANLGRRPDFEPRRRQDVDMIFLAAPERGVGRLLAPALRFHFAGDIPTYATSDIHEPGSEQDRDLDDIYFPDAPWLLAPDGQSAALKRALETYWPRRAASSAIRLYAMGVDAYRLVGMLYRGEAVWPFRGLTGDLELAASGRVHRLLPFAQFRNGRPVALEPAGGPQRLPELDTGEGLARFR